MPLARRLSPMALVLWVAWAVHQGAAAQPAVGPVAPLTAASRVELRNGPLEELVCPSRPVRPARPASPPDPDPLQMPDEDALGELLKAAPWEKPRQEGPAQALQRSGARFRVAIWGDSHIAAGFFTEELVRLLGLGPEQARPALLPAAFGRPGIRLPIRRSCTVGEWRYEPTYFHPGKPPGPGLVSMVATGPGAEVLLDLRPPRSAQALVSVSLLYEAFEGVLRVALSVDGGPEQEVALPPGNGPAALDIAAERPVSQVKLRLLEGTLRLHGVTMPPQEGAPVQLDVFGYPGATVAGWGKTSPGALSPWFGPDAYDLAILAFGTNEGNVRPFDPVAYRKSLSAAVARLRETLPQAQCILISPGDRGVLVRRSQSTRNAKGKAKASARKASPAPASRARSELLRFSGIHGEIGAIQQEVAKASGCWAWSGLEAMGGPGSAYRWVKEGLMAPDLIHFTAKGYQRLAQLFAADSGWMDMGVTPRR